MFLLVITWVPFMLGSWHLVCYLPRSKPSTLSCTWAMPWGGARDQMLTDQIEHLENSCWNLCIQMLLHMGKGRGHLCTFDVLFSLIHFISYIVCNRVQTEVLHRHIFYTVSNSYYFYMHITVYVFIYCFTEPQEH